MGACHFQSWKNQRAKTYRIKQYPRRHSSKCAINGLGMGDDYATGVAFTRNPTGEKVFMVNI